MMSVIIGAKEIIKERGEEKTNKKITNLTSKDSAEQTIYFMDVFHLEQSSKTGRYGKYVRLVVVVLGV